MPLGRTAAAVLSQCFCGVDDHLRTVIDRVTNYTTLAVTRARRGIRPMSQLKKPVFWIILLVLDRITSSPCR
jgi:hypothetical protein